MGKFNLTLIGTCAVTAFTLGACATQDGPSAISEVASTAPTVTKTETTTVAGATDKADPNRRICKRQAIVGSNMKKRVCATAAQWEEEEKLARKAAAKLQGGFRSQGGSN